MQQPAEETVPLIEWAALIALPIIVILIWKPFWQYVKARRAMNRRP